MGLPSRQWLYPLRPVLGMRFPTQRAEQVDLQNAAEQTPAFGRAFKQGGAVVRHAGGRKRY